MMKIATFNCNSVRTRLEVILHWLKENQPDVLALQETKTADPQFPREAFADEGWQVAFCGEKSYNGVAVVTKEKPERVSFGLGDDGGESRTRLAHLVYGGIHILNTYVPQGREFESEQFPFKLQWFARLSAYLEKNCGLGANGVSGLQGCGTIWVGDLNVAPEPIDVHDSKKIWPHVCHCQEVCDAFGKVTKLGLTDIFRKFLPGPGNFTFWDYRVKNALERGLGWRIDHVLATPELAARATGCRVDVEPRRLERPSDHTFVLAEFDV